MRRGGRVGGAVLRGLMRRSAILVTLVLCSWSCLSGCAVGSEPFTGLADAGLDSGPFGDARVDTGKPSGDSAATDTAAPPGDCKVVINELQTGDGTGATAEFVEVYNACATTASLDGFKLVYRSASGTTDSTLFTFASGATIGARGYLVFGGASFSGAVDGALVSGLAAGGASLALKDASGAVVDSVAYGSGTGEYVEGAAAPAPTDKTPAQSLARVPNGADTADNSADFKVGAPTPGAAN